MTFLISFAYRAVRGLSVPENRGNIIIAETHTMQMQQPYLTENLG